MSPDPFGTPELFVIDAKPAGRERLRRPRSVAQAFCPCCHRETAKGDRKLTGLVRQGDHLVWRPHDIVTWAGTRIPCRASSVPACQTDGTHVRCPHEGAA